MHFRAGNHAFRQALRVHCARSLMRSPAHRATRAILGVLLLSALVGCDHGLASRTADGPGSTDGPVTIDAAVSPRPDAAPRSRDATPAADVPPHPTYTTTADFDRSGCQPGGFDQLALDGIWAFEILDGPLGLGLLPPGARFTRNAGALEGWLSSMYQDAPLEHLDQSSTELFFYQHPFQGFPGDILSILACHTDPATSHFDGSYALCFNGRCGLGHFRAGRVDRLVGEGESGGLSKLGELGVFRDSGPAISVNVRVSGNLAFLARYSDGLRILDVSDPAAIREVAHAPIQTAGEIYNDVKLVGGVAFMASDKHGVVSFDVSNPPRPVRLPNLVDGYNVHSVFILGTTLYACAIDWAGTGVASGLAMFDISNPRAPTQLGQLYQPERAALLHDLYVEPGRAYLDYWDAGLIIVDLTDPLRPRELGRYDGYARRMTNHSSWVTTIGGRKICITGDEDFGAHARILDVTNPAEIHLLSEWQTRPEVSIHNILADGDRAYIAHYQDGVRVLDLSNPAEPRQTAYFNTWDPAESQGAFFFQGALGIDKVGDRLYVADAYRGLLILSAGPQALGVASK